MLLWWFSGTVAEPRSWVGTGILYSAHIWAIMGVGRRWLGILEACWGTLLQVLIPFFTRVLVSSQFCQLAALQRVIVKSSHLLLPWTALWLFWRRQLFNSWSSAGMCLQSADALFLSHKRHKTNWISSCKQHELSFSLASCLNYFIQSLAASPVPQSRTVVLFETNSICSLTWTFCALIW